MSANTDRSEPAPAQVLEARYEVERTLGQGSAGIVYQVLDRETGERLALKKLLRMDLKSVTRLKQEFRALADLHHPNLIKLYDLGHADDAWFITMEHLKGSDLLTYLSVEGDPFDTAQRRAQVANTNDIDAAQRWVKLGRAFQQLARGVHALHRAGMLHRDLKPSNVMVAQERVVVLDFGLVREVGEHAATVTQDDVVAGTPAYMAPEQVTNSVLSEATDWYAFGVMLYEALSGRLPLEGRLFELLRLKLERDPQPIAELVPELDPALAGLCTALLQRTAAARPGYEQIMEALGPLVAGSELSLQEQVAEQFAPSSRNPGPASLVGRALELSSLARGFQDALTGGLVVVHVRGPSGAGKSALVEQFLERVEQQGAGQDRLVLRARCYEREAMPFKALDGLLESLVRYLLRLDEVVVGHMLPVNVAELARAFPVLERLPAVKRLLTQAPARGDAARERTRAERALRELLRRVAMHWSLVLWIDDLQWGDLDSVSVLKGWLETSEALPLLMVLSYRGDEHETNACLKLLGKHDAPRFASESTLEITPLSAGEVEALCLQTFGPEASERAMIIERIVSESQGSPFLARQLLTLAQARIAQGELLVSALSIDGLVSQVTALLSDPERALLNVLAVAGRPVTLRIALKAASIRRAGRSQLHALTGLNLTRMRVVTGRRLLEVYHDRIREAVVAALTPEQRIVTHRKLLLALEQSGETDADWLHLVAVGADDNAAALRYGRAAADHAVTTLAFERAAALYRECLSRMDPSDARALEAVWRKLGDAFAACGYGSRAAAAYLAASKHAPADAVVELKRLAASHSIRSGLFEQGEALVQQVLDAMQLSVPRSEPGLIAAIAWERARLSVRGLDFEPRAPASLPQQRVLEVLTYGAFSIDTQAYDPVRATLFQARALRIALELGAPALVASALCVTATMRAVSSSARDERYVEQVLDRAQALISPHDDVLGRARVLTARAMCAFLSGRIGECLRLSAESQQLWAQHTYSDAELPGEYYHRFALNAARIGALFQMGRLREAGVELGQALLEARAAENRTALLHLSMIWAVHDIAQGHAQRARTRLDADRGQLPPQGFGPLHMLHMVAVMRVGCAVGDYAWMDAVIGEMWPRFERSIVRHTVFAMLAYGSHARYLLNRHVLQRSSGDPRALLRRDMRAMERVGPALYRASYSRFEARLAYLAGDRERAIALYRSHCELCLAREYRDEYERGRWALGHILGGDAGAQLCASALAALRELGVHDPVRELPGHFPELWPSTTS